MFYYLVLLSVVWCVSATTPLGRAWTLGPAALSPRDTDLVHTIQLPVDHFNPSDQRTWSMRYITPRTSSWTPGGPIIISLGGMFPISKEGNVPSLMQQLTAETRGKLFATEHRYYGESVPVPNDLQYLTSRQALADLAALVRSLKSTYRGSKVVVAGFSYSGNLAAWSRLLYPDLVDAALASSAPVLAKTDFKEYLETVSVDLSKYTNPFCFENIARQFELVDRMFRTKQGIAGLKMSYNICDNSDLTVPENQFAFVQDAVERLKLLTQFGTAGSIHKACDRSLWDLTAECTPIDFSSFINFTRQHHHSWTYQTCNEFGYWQSTGSGSQPFGTRMPVEIFYKVCQALFGKEYTAERIERSVAKTNAMYGGRTPAVRKVIFTNGELDPWHRLGVLKDLSPDAPALFIPKTSHMADVASDSDGDSDELLRARRIIKNTLKKWIGFPSEDVDANFTSLLPPV